MDRGDLIEVFGRLDDALAASQTLCMIGASAILGFGHPTRQTDEIDVWRPASRIDGCQMARAAEVAGVAVDRGTALPEGVHIRFIDPGVVQLPAFDGGLWATGERKDVLWTGGKLTVEAPPPSIIAAAKLVRAEDRDIDDCVYLVRAKSLSEEVIRRAIGEIADPIAREAAAANLALLQVVAGRDAPTSERKKDGGGRGPVTARETWVKGVKKLKKLLKDDLVLARAVRERDYETLLAVAVIAERGLGEAMAMTDPALYRALSGAIVLMNLKGYGALNVEKLRELAAAR